MKKQIVVLSPHFDDAVLSCFDHLTLWKDTYKIAIFTIFSSFSGEKIPQFSENLLRNLHFSQSEFEAQRKNEDRNALKLLGLQQYFFDFVDGGFRSIKNIPVYAEPGQLFSGTPSKYDEVISEKLESIFKLFSSNIEKVIIPSGVGNHADHKIVRAAAEKVIPKHALFYYLDYPYALQKNSFFIRFKKRTTIHMSEEKRRALACYSSQIPLLFPQGIPQFDEVIYQ